MRRDDAAATSHDWVRHVRTDAATSSRRIRPAGATAARIRVRREQRPGQARWPLRPVHNDAAVRSAAGCEQARRRSLWQLRPAPAAANGGRVRPARATCSAAIDGRSVRPASACGQSVRSTATTARSAATTCVRRRQSLWREARDAHCAHGRTLRLRPAGEPPHAAAAARRRFVWKHHATAGPASRCRRVRHGLDVRG